MSPSLGKEIQFAINERVGAVSGLLLKPEGARALLALAHGAGAGMRHRFMENIAGKFASRGIATLRYQFPYMEKRIKRPDGEAVLVESVAAAITAAKKSAAGLPLFAGGKSMGGRITSLAAARQGLDPVQGLVFFGFPLHAAGRPGTERAEHLFGLQMPMLFLQGSRDALADLKLLKPLCEQIGPRGELFVVNGGDHSFHMLKSAGRSDDDVLDDVVEKAAQWMKQKTVSR